MLGGTLAAAEGEAQERVGTALLKLLHDLLQQRPSPQRATRSLASRALRLSMYRAGARRGVQHDHLSRTFFLPPTRMPRSIPARSRRSVALAIQRLRRRLIPVWSAGAPPPRNFGPRGIRLRQRLFWRTSPPKPVLGCFAVRPPARNGSWTQPENGEVATGRGRLRGFRSSNLPSSRVIARVTFPNAGAGKLRYARRMGAGVLKGRCGCRVIEFEVSDEFVEAYNCHCSNCRAMTGSAFKPGARSNPRRWV